MRKSKRFLAAALAAMTAASLLTGCGGSGSKESPQGSTEQGAEKSEEQKSGSTDGEKVNLRFVSWQTAYKDLNEKVAEAYQKDHPNVTITYDYYGDMTAAEYYKKVDLMVMGGEEMDILMTSAFPEHAQRAGSGAYLPLEEYFEKEGVKPEDAYSIVQKVNGKMYGIPGDLKSWFVLINKDYLDEAGLPVPGLDWTWEDYREYANKMTQGEGASKRYGSYFHSWDHYDYMGMWSNYPDNPMFNADMTAVNFDHPMFKEWLQFRYDLENTDKCQVPFADVKSMNMNYRDKFFNGQIAMLPIGNFIVPELDDQDKYPHEFVTTFAPIPAWKDAETGTTYTESHFYSISKTSKHPQEAYDFIRFYTTEGMKIRGISVSAEKGIDKMEFMKMQIDDPKYVDMEALETVMNNPAWKDNVYQNVPTYNKEMSQMMVDECSKFLLGTDSLDNTIASLMKNGAQMMKDKGQK